MCSNNTGHFFILSKLYLKMFPVKFMTKNNIINSNQRALNIKFLEYGVGEVSWPASKNVPIPIATANTINNIPVNLVEKRML